MEKTTGKSSIYNVIEDILAVGVPGFLVILMGIVITAEILGRLILNRSFQGIVDLTENIVVLTAFLSLAGVQAGRSHITVDVLYEKLKHRRAGAVMDCIALGISIAVMAFVFGELVWYLVRAHATGMSTVTLFWPVWPFVLCMVLGVLLFILRMIIQLKESFLRAVAFRKVSTIVQPEKNRDLQDLQKEEI